ncbi:hypothetical protein K2173_009154 [Erythroxylum novogranatense]|uniref:Zinc metallopeptidase EGY3, chloroplastic n=1 Tax=Erythroxylum novogranatense TaxID=1862640 RepID=A0AAV8TD05_9ROSI|nr:hypothetical protein K2173_009154 [Erythroxylum novogranatense]
MATTVSVTSRSSLSPCTLRNKNNCRSKSKPCRVMVIGRSSTRNCFVQKGSFSFSLQSKSKPSKPIKFIILNELESGVNESSLSSFCAGSSFGKKKLQCLSLRTKPNLLKPLKFSAKDEQESEPSSSTSVAVVNNNNESKQENEVSIQEEEMSKENIQPGMDKEEQQEMDWKTDEEFKKFMGNPSIEAAIKLEKKRADRKLKELDRESSGNLLVELFNRVVRDRLTREKERLEKAEETFKALDLNKLKSCFGFDTFFATDVRRFGDGGIFVGNLRRPIEEVIPKLQKKLSEAAGREVLLWFMEEKNENITKQFESTKLSTPLGYLSAVVLCVATFGTIALMSGFFLKPNATFDDYVANVVPLFGGFLTILGVSEIATRVTAARYGVKLSPSFLVPSNWTGCLGVMNNYESLLPNKKALFDIPVARTASAYLTSLLLAIVAFVSDGSFNGGDNALRPWKCFALCSGGRWGAC